MLLTNHVTKPVKGSTVTLVPLAKTEKVAFPVTFVKMLKLNASPYVTNKVAGPRTEGG